MTYEFVTSSAFFSFDKNTKRINLLGSDLKEAGMFSIQVTGGTLLENK
jgi:hypothetical protein